MYETFRARAQAVSAEVHRVSGRQAARELVLARLRAEGVADAPGQWAVWAEGPSLRGVDRAALAGAVPGLRFDVTKDSAAGAKVGVTDLAYAIANTGTIAGAGDAVEGRLASSLPPVHVALVPSAGLVADLSALFAKLGPAQSAFVTLITGPSRTADIERVLTIGVHGPERLVIVVVDDEQGRAP